MDNSRFKFRAWWKSQNRMQYNGEHHSQRLYKDLCIHLDGSITGFCGSQTPILMQYTGLHDRNGKEIYESDVVRYVEGCTIGVVVFGECVFESYYVVMGWTVSGTYDFIFSQQEASRMEVIGNIYENPDLVK